MRIVGRIDIADELLASSGFADLRSGTYRGRFVAIKTLRVTSRDDFVKIRKVSINGIFAPSCCAVSIIPLQRFCKEVVLWGTFSHPNILKLVGVQDGTNGRQFAIVSEWMSNGNIMEFIENNPANRLDLVRGITFPRHFLYRSTTIAIWGSPGSEIPPRHQYYTR